MKRASALALALLCALQFASLLRAPELWSPAAITVTLAPGEAITLGRTELAAPLADLRHLAVRRDAAGAWWLRNASSGKQVLVDNGGAEHRVGGSTIQAGQSIEAGGARFAVTDAGAGRIRLHGAGSVWDYDGATLRRDGKRQQRCAGSSWLSALAARPLAFGGNLHCGNRIGVAGLAPGALLVRREQDQLRIGGDAEEALSDTQALTAGHTRFKLAAAQSLQLQPSRQVALVAQPAIELPPQVRWQWRQRSLWTLPGGPAWQVALALCAVLAVGAALAWQRGAWPFGREESKAARLAAIAAALLAVSGLTALLLQRAGTPPGAFWSALLGCAALWCWLLLPGRVSAVTAAGVLLLAIGLLAQLELGLGALETSSLRHFQKTSALLALGLGAGALLRLHAQRFGSAPPQLRVEWTLAALAGAALALLALQVLFGDETGVFDMQPVEFAKLALAALTAHCLAVGAGWHKAMPAPLHPARRWLRLGAPVLLFCALLGVALVQVDDYSPLVLLLVWTLVMGGAWTLAARRRIAACALLALACGGAAGIALAREAGAGEMAQLGFYADRFLVWLDPGAHPHTGQQLLLGARAIAAGGWSGADGMFGLSVLGQPAGAVLAIPAVQDDFAPSFFLNRHGLAGALLLWALQALFLHGLFSSAAASLAAAGAADFRLAWQMRFRCFALCGGAAFMLGHLLLSWGSNLAIVPVMGQPMSFLSAGGSHLLFFICPLLTLGAVSAQSLEENRSCRSMSNTKC